MTRLTDVIAKPRRRILGLISGMSMDGVNLACVDIEGDFPDLKVDIVGHHYRPYAQGFPQRLRAAFGSQAQAPSGAQNVSELNVLVAREFSACVHEFLSSGAVAPDSVDAIGSHGQTLYHSSGAREECFSTLQIGAPSLIAELTGLITVGNFRGRDLMAGGQGAPLVSLADFVLFHRPGSTVALNNLGSISNLTVVTPRLEDVIAFDTGPANMAIDFFARRIPGNTDGIDRDGLISARGTVIRKLLAALLEVPFFSREPPKAAGYDEFGPEALQAMAAGFMGHSHEDLVRTGVEYCAQTLADAYRRFVLPRYPTLERVELSGGGARNPTLVGRIGALLLPLEVRVMAEEFLEWKEAIAFAILANETLSGRPGNLPSVTGARHAVILGEIAP